MVEQSRWVQKTLDDPNHSNWYVERFRQKAADGEDLAGEARLIDAMVGRQAHILDAGCGPGRIGGYLHQAGHHVVGVDVDPVLIAAAEQDHPGPTWLVGDLAELDLNDRLGRDPNAVTTFDAIVSAGNVMTFLAPSTRVEVLRRLGQHLKPDGRLVTGFGLGRDYEPDEFFGDVDAADLNIEVKLSTWDLRPFDADSTFLVSVLGRRDR